VDAGVVVVMVERSITRHYTEAHSKGAVLVLIYPALLELLIVSATAYVMMIVIQLEQVVIVKVFYVLPHILNDLRF
jgi:hypothetical protein